MPKTLSTNDHDRNVAGLRYVYPVISRRSGGLSIGINFNPNNACNWHCVYCQVPGLQRGNAPEMDFDLLERELRSFLNQVLNGDFYQRFNVPEPQRVIKDIAISGNGEPTSLKNFDRAIDLIGEIASQAGVFPGSRYVLISNGSLIHQSAVQQGLRILERYNGELWFKLDSATEPGRKLINQTGQSQQKLLEHLQIAAKLCRTKIQTCVFSYRFAWSDQEKQAYLSLLKQLRQMGMDIEQVMLYSLARPSLQAEAVELAKASAATMDALAADVKALGYNVSVSY